MAQKDKIRADSVNTGLIELKFSADVPFNFLVKGINPNIDPPPQVVPRLGVPNVQNHIAHGAP